MAYFSNGSAGMEYEAQYCDHCVHQNGPDGESGCAIWLAHMVANYSECNDEKSVLHILIPRSKDGLGNERCRLFFPIPGKDSGVPEPIVELTDADHRYLAWQTERHIGRTDGTVPEPEKKKVAA